MKKIPKRYLKPWLQGRKYLYPFTGVSFLLYAIIVIPFIALWEVKDDALEALKQGVALTLCQVEE